MQYCDMYHYYKHFYFLNLHFIGKPKNCSKNGFNQIVVSKKGPSKIWSGEIKSGKVLQRSAYYRGAYYYFYRGLTVLLVGNSILSYWFICIILLPSQLTSTRRSFVPLKRQKARVESPPKVHCSNHAHFSNINFSKIKYKK